MKKIFNNFGKIFLFFLYLQPILDITSGILIHFGYNITISSAIRLLFMLVCVIYLVFNVKYKKINIYLISLFIYFCMFTITTLITKDAFVLVYELKNLLTTYYFVILLLTLFELYKKEDFNIKNLAIIYITYLVLVFVPNILGIGFDSYWHSKEGSVGWFVSANVVGSIVSILLPLLLFNIKKIDFKLIILSIINLYVIFSIGTKVPVLAFIIIISINLLYYIINLIRKKEYKKLTIIVVPLILAIMVATFLFPKTSFYKNIVIHINYLEKQDNGKISTNHLIDHFIFSQRLTFEENTRHAYNNSSLMEKVFGIGYIENYSTDNVSFKTIEIDYFDVFYRHGVLGFILFFYPIIYLLIKSFKNIKITSFKELNILLSIILIFLLALFQGHIFITPANSIFVALIIALTCNKKIREIK